MPTSAEKKQLIRKARIAALSEIFWSWLGACVGIGGIALVTNNLSGQHTYSENWF